MSNTVRKAENIVTAHRQMEGGGFVVRRPFPGAEIDSVDPFLLIDEMGPVEYGPGEAVVRRIIPIAGSRPSRTSSRASSSTRIQPVIAA